MMPFLGGVLNACDQYALGIPVHYLKYVPGWPSLFLSQAQQADLKVYILDVDTPKDLEQVQGLPLDGIVTNRIEIISPLLKR